MDNRWLVDNLMEEDQLGLLGMGVGLDPNLKWQTSEG